MGLYNISWHSTGYDRPRVLFEVGKLYTFRKNKFPSIIEINDAGIAIWADFWDWPYRSKSGAPLLFLGEVFEIDRRLNSYFIIPPQYFSFLMGDAKIWVERKEMNCLKYFKKTRQTE